MAPQDANESAQEEIRSHFHRRGLLSEYDNLIHRIFEDCQCAQKNLAHEDPECRLIATMAISEKWGVDGAMASAITSMLKNTYESQTRACLYQLIGMNTDKTACLDVLRILLQEFDRPSVDLREKCQLYASIIMQTQRLGMFYRSTMPFLLVNVPNNEANAAREFDLGCNVSPQLAPTGLSLRKQPPHLPGVMFPVSVRGFSLGGGAAPGTA